MKEIHNSVFISYRRSTSRHLARLVFNNLREHELDPFLDVLKLKSGDFGRFIVREISARAHFVFLVSHGSLQRCQDPADWVRREFETAVANKRNIVPLYDEGLSPGSLDQYLVGSLNLLPDYNGINLYHEYFDAGLEKLRDWLARPIIVILDERDDIQQAEVDEKIEAAVEAGLPSENELAAEKAYNAAWQTVDMSERLRLFTAAIEADPSHTAAFYERATIYREAERLDEALDDYDHAVFNDPGDPSNYMARGKILQALGKDLAANKDFEAAVNKYTSKIITDPDNMQLYLGRASAHKNAGNFERAIDDCTHVIEFPKEKLRPMWEGQSIEEYTRLPTEDAFWRRGLFRFLNGDCQGAIEDSKRLIQLTDNETDTSSLYQSMAYALRGTAHGAMGHRARAVHDLRKSQQDEEGGGEKLDIFFSGYLLAWPMIGKKLGLNDPLTEMKSLLVSMAEEL